jgi:hypothetical protein
MPKKIVVKKKKVKKPKAPVIIPRKLPRTKCCEEYKTGSAFTIPLGYSDRLGMNRLGQQTPNVTNIYYQQPQPLAKVEPNRNNTFTIQTQTEEPQSIRIPTQTESQNIRIPITYKPIPAKKLYQPVEFQPLEETLSTIPINTIENKNIVIQPRPAPAPIEEPFLSFADIYQEPPAPPPIKKKNKPRLIIVNDDDEEENVVMSQPAGIAQPAAAKPRKRADIFIVADLLVQQKPEMTYADALNYAESLKKQGTLTRTKKELQGIKEKDEASIKITKIMSKSFGKKKKK